MYPTLTMRAIHETPRLQGKRASELVPGPASSLLQESLITEVNIELLNSELMRGEIQPQNMNEILYVCVSLVVICLAYHATEVISLPSIPGRAL